MQSAPRLHRALAGYVVGLADVMMYIIIISNSCHYLLLHMATTSGVSPKGSFMLMNPFAN